MTYPPLSDQPASDFPRVLLALRRQAPAILSATLLSGLGAYLITASQPRVYEASSSLLAEQGGDNTPLDSLVSPSPLPQGALTQALHSPRVVADVVGRLRAASLPAATVASVERELRAELGSGTFSKLSVEASGEGRNSGLYILRARANTPGLARALADASVAALQGWDVQRAQRRLQLARDSLRQQLEVLDQGVESGELIDDSASTQARAQLLRDLAVVGASRRSVAGTLDVVAEAVEPSAPVAPRPAHSALIASLLALLVAGSAAVLLDGRRRRMQEERERARPAADHFPRPLPARETTGVKSAAP